MSLAGLLLLVVLTYENAPVNSMPPSRCYARFNFKDCGGPPVPVMYYYHAGSRCEVGIWRGCRPNFNMFADERECVSTCIFSKRAIDDDYHSFNQVPVEEFEGEDDGGAQTTTAPPATETTTEPGASPASGLSNKTEEATNTTEEATNITGEMDPTNITGQMDPTNITGQMDPTNITDIPTTTPPKEAGEEEITTTTTTKEAASPEEAANPEEAASPEEAENPE